MIPLRLTLRNFLSYQKATLDFSGLHTACICGANGAGKSSLLEAIAWVIWGCSRVTAEDDVIHMGMAEAQVDFTFVSNQRTYRILRHRVRGQGMSLEFQVALEGRGDRREGTGERGEAYAQAEGRIEAEGTTTSISPSSPASPPLTFRSLTLKSVRATQQLILQHIRLDYETFVNSAYLRQGRADEFMLKRASDRKQILADLLKLEQYDELAERAKDQSRQLKGQIELLESNLATTVKALQQNHAVTEQGEALAAAVQQMQQTLTSASDRLQTLRDLAQQQQTWQQQLTWHEQQHRMLTEDQRRLQQELAATEQQQQELTQILQQAAAIAAGYAQFQALQVQEEAVANRFEADQQAQSQRQRYQHHQDQQFAQLQAKLQQAEAKAEALTIQQAELHHTLSKAAEIETTLAQLQQARTQLSQMDQLQAQIAPLLQRRQQIQLGLDRATARLTARLEEVQTAIAQLQTQQDCQPQLQQAVVAVSDRIAELEQRRLYQEQIREKGLERHSFMERLQADQRNYEIQLAEIEQQVSLMQARAGERGEKEVGEERQVADEAREGKGEDRQQEAEDAKGRVMPNTYESLVAKTSKGRLSKRQKAIVKDVEQKYLERCQLTLRVNSLEDLHATLMEAQAPPLPPTSFPPCPLCDRPLDAHHQQLVLAKHLAHRQEILDHLWTIREQLSVSERELQLLREEYKEIDYEVAQYSSALERRGQLQAQLLATAGVEVSRQDLLAEAAAIERSLQTNNYATDLWQELHLLNQRLQALNYDERTHALIRGEVDRWRWVELRHAEIKQAQRKQAQLAAQMPTLKAEIDQLQQQLQTLQQATSHQVSQLDQQIAAIGYHREQHHELRHLLKQAQPWQLHWQELARARQQYPLMQQRSQALTQQLSERQQQLQTLEAEVTALQTQLTQLPDYAAEITALEQHMQTQRSQLDEQLAQLGRLQQQRHQLDTLSTQQTTLKQQLQTTQRQYRVYQELAQAFGKNGIQTLMIENVLPQLETETNRILSRLSANQLHVQFVTQKTSRDASSKQKLKNIRLIETLDILIADAQGTRPYETYSGGEAFRVNFAIRLALAKLLAQRAGTALQMLIIDEGFGTQDAEGCNRLVAAINAIAPDFACILAVTHVPHFKEAFQSRIEVVKTEAGSCLHLAM